jgi:hypothetical protein
MAGTDAKDYPLRPPAYPPPPFKLASTRSSPNGAVAMFDHSGSHRAVNPKGLHSGFATACQGGCPQVFFAAGEQSPRRPTQAGSPINWSPPRRIPRRLNWQMIPDPTIGRPADAAWGRPRLLRRGLLLTKVRDGFYLRLSRNQPARGREIFRYSSAGSTFTNVRLQSSSSHPAGSSPAIQNVEWREPGSVENTTKL